MSESSVSAQLGIGLVVRDQTVIPLIASVYYSSSDPYAIRMAFHVGTDEPVRWIFARDLIVAGMESRQGIGDIRAWPSAASVRDIAAGQDETAETGQPVLNIEVSSPSGRAHFEVPAAAMAGYLERTYQVVPAGQEGRFVNMETELENLLRQA